MQFRHVVIAIGSFVLLSGCQRDDAKLVEKLDQLDSKIDRLEATMSAAGTARANPQRPQRRRPDPKTAYSVPVDGVPFKGPADAPVTIVKAFEFACPACERARAFDKQILAELGDQVKLAYKNFIVHPNRAKIPAHAACAANRQGQYFAMKELIWDKGFKAGKLDAANMQSLASSLGLDMARFTGDMNGECVAIVARDHAELAKIGTGGTPTFYVNGRPLAKRSIDGLKALVAEESKKAAARIGKGTRAADYYAEWIVKKGKKTL
jgi:protein-disulfide isomerase